MSRKPAQWGAEAAPGAGAMRRDDSAGAEILERFPLAMYAVGADGATGHLSPALQRVLGMPQESSNWQLAHLTELIHPDDRERVLEELAAGRETLEPFRMEYRLQRHDGAYAWVLDEAVFIRDARGDTIREGFLVDITERVQALEDLSVSEERFRTLLSNIPGAMYRCDLDSDWDMQFISDNIEAISGYPASDFIRSHVRTFASIIHPDDRQTVEQVVGEAVARGEPYILEYRIVGADGGIRWVYEKGQGVFDTEGKVLWLDGAIFDVTERKLLQEQLAKQAFYDSLTGLANRALFQDRADHALARAARRGSGLAVLLLDLDGFKLVNDSMGHQVGDEVLVTVAKRILRSSRTSDTVARLGGDEFVILLEEDASESTAASVAGRILSVLREPFLCQGREVSLGGSIGIALTSGSDLASTDELLRDADAAMYCAKANGRDRFELFEPSMHARAVEQLELITQMQRGLERGEFVLHYQPIWELADGTLTGVESLVRWNHPSLGLLAPGEFIPAAEQTGFILPLGTWVLDESCRQARVWQEAFPARQLSVSVNISPRQLIESDLVGQVRAALQLHEVHPGSLTLDITEGALLHDVEETKRKLDDLKALGVRLAIDDFGTGSSSLGYLRRFPLDELKIDRSFVMGMTEDAAEGTSLVHAIVELAGALHLDVVAEGIELPEQLARLRESGCATGQGFLFAEPSLPEEIGSLLERIEPTVTRVDAVASIP
jgi:diguanylate cyclase (GGDEF)-like protein/PAS domain S-box-containing protein